MNNYTDTKATNINKKDSRSKIADDITNRIEKDRKVIHYLGGKNPWTPFEDFFGKDKNTTFIRYENKYGTPLPDNYLDEKTFKQLYPNNMDGVIRWLKGKEDKQDILNEMKSLQKEIDSKYGCFVNGNFFSKHGEYVKMFPNRSHIFWLDFCSTPKPQLLKDVMKIVNAPYSKEIYVTFYMNHRGHDPVAKIISIYGKSLENRAKALKDYCQAGNMQWGRMRKYTCEVFDTYNNDKSPMAVLKFRSKDMVVFNNSIIEKYKKEQLVQKRTFKPASGKTAQDYVEASKRFTNKQLAVLWKMPLTKIAGFAAAAKRKELV